MAPWRYYRSHVCAELAKYCQVCDAEFTTEAAMKRDFKSLFQNLSLWDHDPHCEQSVEDQLCDLCEQFEQMLPEESKECLIYALMLVERSFGHGVFVHSRTVKR